MEPPPLAASHPILLAVSPTPAHVRTSRLVAVAVARELGVADAVLEEVRLAVGEACTRAVNAHELHGIEELVELEFSVVDRRFVVAVRDRSGTGAGLAAWDSSAAGSDVAASFVENLAADAAAVELAVVARLVPDTQVLPLATGGSEVRMTWPMQAS